MQESRKSHLWAGNPWTSGGIRAKALAMLVAGALSACGDRGPDGSGVPLAEPGQPEARPLERAILHINGLHANRDSQRKTLKLLNASNERVNVSVDAGGFPRVTAAFAELAAKSGNVLKLHAGDALTGTLYFSRAAGNRRAGCGHDEHRLL